MESYFSGNGYEFVYIEILEWLAFKTQNCSLVGATYFQCITYEHPKFIVEPSILRHSPNRNFNLTH